MRSKNIRLNQQVVRALVEVMSTSKVVPTHTEIREARGLLSQEDAARVIGRSRKGWQKFETAPGQESRTMDPELLALYKLKMAVIESGLLEQILE